MKPADCAHMEFAVAAAVARLTDGEDGPVRNFVAEIKISCKQCGSPFRFIGAPTGYAFKHPTCDVPATTLHAPIGPGERTLAEIPTQISFEMPPRVS